MRQTCVAQSLTRKIVYVMYRDIIQDFTNTPTYPDCRDTRCRDNECRLYFIPRCSQLKIVLLVKSILSGPVFAFSMLYVINGWCIYLLHKLKQY